MFPRGFRKSALLLAIAAGIILLASCQPQQSTKYDGVIADLEKLIPLEMERAGISGISIALVDDQEIVWARGFGFSDNGKKLEATEKTVYRVGSISKLFTDIAVMQLQEEGKISIDADITEYIPEFHMVRPFETDKPTTLRQLMTHCSGFIRESPVGSYFDDTEPTIEETVKSIYGLEMVYPPETNTKYSNVGITTVGYALQRVAGKPYADLVREKILAPIGMESSDFAFSEKVKENLSKAYMWVSDGHKADGEHIVAPVFQLGTIPAGNLYSTVEDLGRFHSCIFNSGKAGEKQIIKKETLEMMMTRQFDAEGHRRFGIGFVVGDFHGHKTYGHGGAVYGFSSSFIGMPDQKIGVVVLSNEDVANACTDKIAIKALGLMLEARTGEKLPETAKRIDVPAEKLADYTGTFESDAYWVEIQENDGKLDCLLAGQKTDLEPVAEDAFIIYGRNIFESRAEFHRAEDGTVDGLKYGGLDYTRIERAAAPEHPEIWDKLVGSYGKTFIPVIITIKFGHLYAFVENVSDYRLEQLSDTVYKFNYGLYEGENLTFVLGEDGNVEHIDMANVVFEPIR